MDELSSDGFISKRKTSLRAQTPRVFDQVIRVVSTLEIRFQEANVVPGIAGVKNGDRSRVPCHKLLSVDFSCSTYTVRCANLDMGSVIPDRALPFYRK